MVLVKKSFTITLDFEEALALQKLLGDLFKSQMLEHKLSGKECEMLVGLYNLLADSSGLD